MDCSKYLAALDLKADYVECPYCGAMFPLGKNGSGFCSFCEGFYDESVEAGREDDLAQMAGLHGFIKKSALSELENALASLQPKTLDPFTLFAKGSFYRYLSNYRYYDLDYNRQGFMEENSSNIYESLDLTAKYKEFFYKAIKVSKEKYSASPNEILQYMQFITNLKLKRRFQAGLALREMKTSAKNRELLDYSEMAYLAESADGNALEMIGRLSEAGNLNSLYYLGEYLVLKKLFKDAEHVLQALIDKVEMHEAAYLLHRVRTFIDETSL